MSQPSFNPSYKLAVETAGGGNVSLELPLQADFEIRRATLPSSQTATFRVYGVGEQNRDAIQKDWFNTADVRAVQFSAGYGDVPPPRIFNGTMKQAQSYKPSAATEFITEIEAFDGGAAIANGYSLRSIAGGTTFKDLIKTLAKDLPGVSADAIVGKIEGATKRASAYAGNTWQYINGLAPGQAFIDNGRLIVLNPNEYIGEDVLVIDSAAGLLASPQRQQNMISVSVLFDPRFSLANLVELRSKTIPKFNGVFKIMSLTHRGTISRNGQDGERTTDLTIWDGLSSAGSWEQVQ